MATKFGLMLPQTERLKNMKRDLDGPFFFVYTLYMNWTEYFLNIAETVKLKSKDKRTQIGAVIVGRDNEIVSTGYNSFPRGIDDEVDERQVRPEKYYWIVHAEMNAILNAARIGVVQRTVLCI